MAKKSGSTAGYGLLALIVIIAWLFSNKTFLIVAGVIVGTVVIGVLIYYYNKWKKEIVQHEEIQPQQDDEDNGVYGVFGDSTGNDRLVHIDIKGFPDNIQGYLVDALKSEAAEDFLQARVFYMQAVEVLKRNTTEYNIYIEPLQKMYDKFVLRDPYYKKLLQPLIGIIEKNDGILQSEITKQFESSDWGNLKLYDRPVLKDDIYYALWFAERFGHIIRVKKGRSYELFLPETVHMAEKVT